MSRPNAAKLVTEALLGKDAKSVTIGDRTYIVEPPTIKKICGAGMYLSDFGEEQSIGDTIKEFKEMDNIAHAASWFINGDDTLAEEFMGAQLKELLSVIEVALTLIDVQNFTRLLTLARNVKMAIAKQRP